MTMERQPFDDVIPIKNGDVPDSHVSLGGGFKHFLFFTTTWGNDPI